jgi:Lon protease-like protein
MTLNHVYLECVQRMNRQSIKKKQIEKEYSKRMIYSRMFTDYGTLLFIRGIVYTLDGRSIVDTIGKRRFHVIERGMRDGYNTARVELIRDHQIEQHEFDGLFKFKKNLFARLFVILDLLQLNRDTYQRVRDWFDHLDEHRKTLIMQQLEAYPTCDELTQGSSNEDLKYIIERDF